MICRILLLLIFTSCVSGSFVVNVTQTSYQAEENHNITLEWTFTTNPDRSITSLNILCGTTANDSVSVLYHVHEGVEVSESQDAKFSGRVQSDKDALREGRIRLQLSRLRTDDSGLYLCEVNTDDGSGSGRCQLKVIAADDQVLPLRPTLRPQPESSGWTTFFIFLGQFVVFLLYFVLLYFICSRKKLKDLKKQHIMPQSKVTQEQLKNKVTEICQSGKGYKVISKALGLQ